MDFALFTSKFSFGWRKFLAVRSGAGVRRQDRVKLKKQRKPAPLTDERANCSISTFESNERPRHDGFVNSILYAVIRNVSDVRLSKYTGRSNHEFCVPILSDSKIARS